MSYHTLTVISGATTLRKPAFDVTSNAGVKRMMQWMDKNYWNGVRNGHSRPEAALATARRNGVVGPVEVTHSTPDMSGKRYGTLDYRCLVDENGVTEIPIDAAESDAWAEQQSAEILELDDA